MNSNLIGKVVEQLSGGSRGGGGSSGSGGLVHKVQDAVTGQKHPGDSQGSQGSGQYGIYRSLLVVHASLADISLLPGNYPNAPAHGSNQPTGQYGQSQYGEYPPQGGQQQGGQQQGHNRENYSQGGHGGESGYGNQGGPEGYNSGQGTYSGPGYGGHGNTGNDGHGNQGYGGRGNQGHGGSH